MIECGCGVQRGHPKQAVSQQLVHILREMEDAGIRGDAKVQLGESIVEGPSMPDKGDEPENRDHDHQRIEEVVRRKRNPPIELADVGRQIGRFVRDSPSKSGDDEREIDEPDAAVEVDPERARFLRDLVKQQTQG